MINPLKGGGGKEPRASRVLPLRYALFVYSQGVSSAAGFFFLTLSFFSSLPLLLPLPSPQALCRVNPARVCAPPREGPWGCGLGRSAQGRAEQSRAHSGAVVALNTPAEEAMPFCGEVLSQSGHKAFTITTLVHKENNCILKRTIHSPCHCQGGGG